MKKIIIILLLPILLTGCSIKKINNSSVEQIISNILLVENKMHNISLEGYKYYLPQGTSIIDKAEYNVVIKDKNYKYFLFIDTTAYSYQTDFNYEENNKAYYSKSFTKNKKDGYVEINEINDKYFIEVMYNYAKIESYVNKDNLQEALTNISYILSSVKYNNIILGKPQKDTVVTYQEETFEIFKSTRKEGNFLDYVEEYDKYEKNEETKDLPDEDNLETNESSD